MLRRAIFRNWSNRVTATAATGSIRSTSTDLSGNRIIGIRREDKNVWERRTPLIPDHVRSLLHYKQVDRVIVQPSTTRCFIDSEYEQVGAEINEDLSAAGTILAVKEVPGDLILPNRSYMFFSHTIKAQAYNMPLLDTLVSSNVRLFDYERILGPDGRIVKFGPQAGYAGAIDCLNALGLALMTRGFATPFLNISLSREYRSLEVARTSIRIAGDRIREHGLPVGASPIVIGVTGAGSVSLAAQEILHLLPVKYIDVEDLPKMAGRSNVDNKYIYVCVIKAKDMVTRKQTAAAAAGGGACQFDSRHYYANPEQYEPVFHQRVAPYLSVLITGHYWEPRFPRLLSIDQARSLNETKRLPLLVLADITCDIGGSIEFFVKSTSIQNPFYAYDLNRNKAMDIQDFHGEGIVICGVDHLPAEFPREASQSFGDNLKPLVPIVASSPATVPLPEQKAALGKSLFNSIVTCSGALTPNFEYITEMRRENEAEEVSASPTGGGRKRKVLVFGAGMMSFPAVNTLLQDRRNSIIIVDAVAANLEQMRNQLRKSDDDLDESRVRLLRANAGKFDGYLETLVKSSDVVVSLLPATMHATLAEFTLRHKVPLVTASYVSPAMEKLRATAAASGTYIVNEMGLDPGIDLMTSAALLDSIKAAGGQIKTYISLCGALPAPENSDCPMGYKFSWSPAGVLTAASRPSKVKICGDWYEIPGDHLYYYPQPIWQFRGLDLYWVPNGDATKYAGTFDINDSATIVRGTIRYPGFAGCIRAFKVLGLLDESKRCGELVEEALKKEGNNTSNNNLDSVMAWPELMARCAFGTHSDVHLKQNIEDWLPAFLTEKLGERWAEVRASPGYQAICKAELMKSTKTGPAAAAGAGAAAASDAPQEIDIRDEVLSIMDQLRKLRMLDSDNYCLKTATGRPIDALCRLLVRNLAYRSNERDYVIMYHKVVADFPAENLQRHYNMTLALRGKTQTLSATAETVGIPVGLTAQLVLNGGMGKEVVAGAGVPKPGIVSPTHPSVYGPVLAALEKVGVVMKETVEEVPLTPQSKL